MEISSRDSRTSRAVVNVMLELIPKEGNWGRRTVVGEMAKKEEIFKPEHILHVIRAAVYSVQKMQRCTVSAGTDSE